MKIKQTIHSLIAAFDRFKYKLGISTHLSLIFTFSLLLSVVLVGAYTLDTLYQSTYEDSLSLLTANAEYMGAEIQQKIESSMRSGSLTGDRKRRPDAMFNLQDANALIPLWGNFPAGVSLKNLRLEPKDLDKGVKALFVVQNSGKNYVAAWVDPASPWLVERQPASGKYLGLWELSTDVLETAKANLLTKNSLLYVISTEGRLILSNDESINIFSFEERPLVQSFLKRSISKIYFPIKTREQKSIISGFYKIPDCNLILFIEAKKADVMRKLDSVVKRSLLMLCYITLITTATFQFPMRNIVRPLRRLALIAEHVAAGNIDFKVPIIGYGEVGKLSEAFKKMCESLVAREREINILNQKEIANLRLQKEVEVAQNIQNNLLPESTAIKNGTLIIDSIYRPASQCAGDWYFFHKHPESSSTVFVIADVSGHGVGASMFTAILAGLFNVHMSKHESQWDSKSFIEDVNRTVLAIGKTHWHISLIVGMHNPKSEEVELFFCGHVPAFFASSLEKEITGRFVFGPSDLLGLAETPRITRVTLPFKKGSTLLLFTDGLIEAKNSDGKHFGKRRLAQVMNELKTADAISLAHVMQKWDRFTDGVTLTDDVCVLSVCAA